MKDICTTVHLEIHKAMFFFCFVHRQSLYYTRNDTSIKITRDAHFNRTRVCLLTYHPAYQPCFIRPLISVTDIMYCKVTVPTLSMHSQSVIIWPCVWFAHYWMQYDGDCDQQCFGVFWLKDYNWVCLNLISQYLLQLYF